MFRINFSIIFCIVLNLYSQNDKIGNVVNTGVNMTVAILSVDSFVQNGDTIVALYKINDMNKKDSNLYVDFDDFGLGGLTVWHGERLAIALWGNDSTSGEKDGFFNNEFIHWAVLKNNTYIPVQMIYRVGKNIWEANGISIVDSLKLGC